MTVTEYRQIAVTTWVIAAICVGLAVSGPDVASTYQWLMVDPPRRDR